MKKINFKYFRGYDTERVLRDRQYLDAGYIYAPYIPEIRIPGVYVREYDQSIDRRYARRTINPNYYGRIVVDNDVQSIYGEIIETNREVALGLRTPESLRLSTR